MNFIKLPEKENKSQNIDVPSDQCDLVLNSFPEFQGCQAFSNTNVMTKHNKLSQP